MSAMRASRKPCSAKICSAASTSRARVSAPFRERGPLGFSEVAGAVADTPLLGWDPAGENVTVLASLDLPSTLPVAADRVVDELERNGEASAMHAPPHSPSPMTDDYRSIRVAPIGGALGAEVTGVD